MLQFHLQIDGKMRMARGLARLAESLADYRPVWPAIEDEFRTLIADQFRTKGEEGGAPWAPLSDPYAHWKAVHDPGRPILQRTGDLYRSLTGAHDSNAVRAAEGKSLTLGSRLPYAIYLQKGTRRMPARKAIQLTETFKQSVVGHMRAHLVRVAGQSGFRSRWKPAGMAESR